MSTTLHPAARTVSRLLIDVSRITQGTLKRRLVVFCNRSCGITGSPTDRHLASIDLWLELGFSDQELREAKGLLPQYGLAWIAVYDDGAHAMPATLSIEPPAPLLSLDADNITEEDFARLGLSQFFKTILRRAKDCQSALDVWREILRSETPEMEKSPIGDSRLAAR